MKDKLKTIYDQIINEEHVFLGYLRSKFPFFHKSNFFFRDLEYGLKTFLEKKDVQLSSSENLELTSSLGSYFEEKDYLRKIKDDVWVVNIPEFVTTKPGDPF
jgi:hypothetical protein